MKRINNEDTYFKRRTYWHV